jgi:hypothetical protein
MLRPVRKSSVAWSLLGIGCLVLGTHCASSAKIRSAPNFSGESLKRRAVLILPIAVTDDFGDERTGVVLDRESRERATKLACDSASGMRDDIQVLCFDRPELAKSTAFLKELLLEYARDRAIPAERWRELEQRTGASFVLLFRPEGARASQSVSKAGNGVSPKVIAVSSFAPIPFVVTPPMEGVGPKVDSVKTSRTYTLSSFLIDLREAKVVRTGMQSAEASTSTTEAPDAPGHLHGIMRDLMKGLLEP